MDHQAFFRKDHASFLNTWRLRLPSLPDEPEPCDGFQVLHFLDSDSIEVTRDKITDINVIQWAQRSSGAKPVAQSWVLLGPARPFVHQQRGGFDAFNPKSLFPFKPDTIQRLADLLDIHKAGLTMNECAQTAKFKGPTGVTSIYIENLCHRECWFRLFVVFDPATCISTSILHNLIPKERKYIQERLEDPALQPLTLHPIFVPTLAVELLFYEALQLLDTIHINSVRLYISAKLIADKSYEKDNLWGTNVGDEKEEQESLQYEQRSLILLEKMESAIKIATTLLRWIHDFEKADINENLRSRFQTARDIIQNRLQYVVDTLNLQMDRVKRSQGHTQLNRLGLQLRNATVGNKLSMNITEQSRDIARETKRDSSAMKAIAVLTMFFLPGTFFAAFFAMPLFDWGPSASNSTSLVNAKFWIYWAVTVPSTLLVLLVWRLWYVFDEWRWSREKKGSVYSDFRAWIRACSVTGG